MGLQEDLYPHYAKLVHSGEDRNTPVVIVRFSLPYRIIWSKVLAIFALHLRIFCEL